MVQEYEPFDYIDYIDYDVDLYGQPIVDSPYERDEIGFYHCECCGSRVLDIEMEVSVMKFGHILCPYCFDELLECNRKRIPVSTGGNL